MYRLLWAVLLCCVSVPTLAGTVTDVQINREAAATEVVMILDGPVRHKVFPLRGPDRLVVDLADTRLGASLAGIRLPKAGLTNIRSGVRDGDDLRIVMDLAAPAQARSTTRALPGGKGYELRILLSGLASPAVPAVPVAGAVAAPSRLRDVVVVIDPGHGGRDPGAVGPGGLLEKDVVMQISRKLRDELNATPGFSASLTRDSDSFVSLRQRTRIAQSRNAHLLVSVHADAWRDPRAHGASVYTLSERGATSEAARWLAEKENAADLVGVDGPVSLSDKDPFLRETLLSLSLNYSRKASVDVGEEVLASLRSVNHLHKTRVEKAGFMVLKIPDVPSILVETGFISNPREAARLGTGDYQRELARAIHRGIVAYFTRLPPEGTLLASRRQPVVATYKAISGDTLSAIAHRNNITVSELKEFNGLTRDVLRVGQVLRIPAS